MTLAAWLAVMALSASPEATSFLGEALFPPELKAETKAEYEKNLAAAKSEYENNPDKADSIIWFGRRTAYLGNYRESIRVFTEGIKKFPEDARLYRHRGHRYLSVREIDRAIQDLEKAASLIRGKADEVEPDGIPNEKNIPTSTTQSNIWYHLGLAYYLKGDFDKALNAYHECMTVSKNDDMLVATSHWLYMTLRRLNREKEGAEILKSIRKDMDVIENHDYHRLLLMYQGEITPDSMLQESGNDLSNATVGYGVGNWYLYNGNPEKAKKIFRTIVNGKMWPAFGHLAAEAELARWK